MSTNRFRSQTPKHIPMIFVTPINQDQITHWKPYSNIEHKITPQDCVQTSLGFLNLIDQHVGYQQSKLHNYIKKGTGIPEIIFLLEQKYKHLQFSKISFNTNAFLYHILSNIPQGHGTLGLFSTKHLTGHAVVIAKSAENELVIIDPQSSVINPIRTYEEFMSNYVNKNNFISLIIFQYKLKKSPKSKSKTLKRKRSPNSIRKNKSHEKSSKKRRVKKSS